MARMKTKRYTKFGSDVLLDVRTYAQVLELQKNLDDHLVKGAKRIATRIVQGCYHKGVSASAGTHDLAGCIDISIHGPRVLSTSEIELVVREARKVGLWAWHRQLPEWTGAEHIHANSVDCPDFTQIAANQVAAARKGYNGLGHLGLGGKDRHAYMGLEVISWEHYLAAKAARAAAAKGKPATKPAVVKHRLVPVAKLSRKTKPGAHYAQVADLQRVLVAAHFAVPGAGTDFYGAGTQRAVRAFHKAYPQFGKATDSAIGPKGWVFLQHLAGRG